MKMQDILEKHFQQKTARRKNDSDESTLVEINPGSYMLLFSNEMKRIMKPTQGLELGTRVINDNHKIVLVDEEVILVPFSE